ncbi:MAG: hypothetical protein AAFZ15_24705 [Bacteroidota bacterium]
MHKSSIHYRQLTGVANQRPFLFQPSNTARNIIRPEMKRYQHQSTQTWNSS